MTEIPTSAEVEAARRLYDEAEKEYVAAYAAAHVVAEKYFAVGKAYRRVRDLSIPLPDFMLRKLRFFGIRGGWTAAKLAKHSYRDLAEVTACLDQLINDGLVVRNGKVYTATSGVNLP